MKAIVCILLCAAGLLALTEYSAARYSYGYGYDSDDYQNDDNGKCDSWTCSRECAVEGVHGECLQNNECHCTYCIQPACKNHCRRKRTFGQCDAGSCHCFV